MTLPTMHHYLLHRIGLLLFGCGLSACGQHTLLPQSNNRTPDTLAALNSRYLPFHAPSPTPSQVPDSARPSACITDTRTGLIWEVKSHEPGLQYQDNTYSWYRSDRSDNGGFEGYTNGGHCTDSHCDTDGYIEAINHLQLCGLTHWRLPRRSELAGLIDYRIRYPGPVTDPTAFPHTIAQFYWSANADANDKDSAWGIGFAFGYDYAYFKSDAARVRLVHDAIATKNALPSKQRQSTTAPRSIHYDTPAPNCRASILATTPATRFVDQGNGTVIDRNTGLMWMRCALGQQWVVQGCSGKAKSMNLTAAHSAATEYEFAGYSDWRLPDITELSGITELRCETPAINQVLFPATQAVPFWSNTPFANDPHKHWLVHFRYGETEVDKDSAMAQVRLVRTPKSAE